MSDLTPIETKLFNDLFNQRGWVLDFTNNTFAQFFSYYNIDIKDESLYKGSKGNRLNTFLEIESNHCVANVLEGLIEYKVDLEGLGSIPEQKYKRCVEIVKKLKCSPNAKIDSLEKLSHKYIKENINKCNEKIKSQDYSGAITNARSLIEHLLEYIYQEITGKDFDTDKLPKKYKVLSQNLNLDPAHLDKKISTEELKQILSGFVSIITGMACFSNDWADRHARKFDPQKHHAQLAVNSAFTICEFILSSYEYQHIDEKQDLSE
ncbi:MAG: abortive infection family protein [Candidatus Caenarcaniphilales bacterium]|nr:abortive infection family protein [Candidatus Caenarcaniphilales bacterium]